MVGRSFHATMAASEATVIFPRFCRHCDPDYVDAATLAAVIARSPIIVPARAARLCRLPAGFGDTDLKILDWIAAEGQRLGRSLAAL